MFQNRLLTETLGPKTDTVTEERMGLSCYELHDLYSSAFTLGVIK
jgi:hypothetical protein